MDGVFDTGNTGIGLAHFDGTNPRGHWVNDVGNQTGSCSSMEFHIPDTVNRLVWDIGLDVAEVHSGAFQDIIGSLFHIRFERVHRSIIIVITGEVLSSAELSSKRGES